MRSGTELAQDIQLTDWSRAREHVKNLSNQFSGVQISCDICTRFGRYLYSTKQCWIIRALIVKKQIRRGALIRKGALIGRRALNRIITVLGNFTHLLRAMPSLDLTKMLKN